MSGSNGVHYIEAVFFSKTILAGHPTVSHFATPFPRKK
jgi:hypothetical protein